MSTGPATCSRRSFFNRNLGLVGIIPNQILFSSLSAPTKIERCVFSSDPAVSSSIFVGAEREENLIILQVSCWLLSRAVVSVRLIFEM